ncbi:MAG TPA: gephyrin-like molybdotransferase Glp, partial [Propionibacteriaceae bacterium]|nr:gephyrin-like molybdotransferase Glp [Propionibacteriaceae bacterium]
RTAVPAFANSAMDGFAVRHCDLAAGVALQVVADVPAGSSADPDFGAGECVRIMTGAPVPSAADTIVQVEHTTVASESTVVIDVVPPLGAHVRRAAEDMALGDRVLASGARLGPRELSALAAAGHADAPCVRRPVVGVVSTGDELVAPGGTLGRGQIFESNATYLASAVARDGGVPVVVGPISDSEDALRSALDALADQCDLIVASGGVSVGDYDVVRLTLADGTFRHVRMQPGKPQGWARWPAPGDADRCVPVVALPGNPLSAAISYEVFVRPTLAKLLGCASPTWTPAVASEGWSSPAGRAQLLPVTVEVDASGRQTVRPAHRRGSASHMVTSLASAEAIALIDADVDQVTTGDLVQIRRLE